MQQYPPPMQQQYPPPDMQPQYPPPQHQQYPPPVQQQYPPPVQQQQYGQQQYPHPPPAQNMYSPQPTMPPVQVQPYPGNLPMQPPPPQFMTTKFDGLPGVVIRQATQAAEMILQAIGVNYESANKYKISVMPPGRRAAREHEDPSGWHPTGQELDALPVLMRAEEESSCFLRWVLASMGWLNLRPLKLHYQGLQQGAGDSYRIERPFKLGGGCWCPPEMSIFEGPTELGKVVEDCSPCGGRCLEACCKCTTYTNILENTSSVLMHKYTVRTSHCCCGRVNNCCGGSCIKHDFIIDVLDEQGNIVTTIQKTYAPGGMGALCRAAGDFSNYILEFPPNATNAQRALLTAAVFQLEYLHFESKGDSSN